MKLSDALEKKSSLELDPFSHKDVEKINHRKQERDLKDLSNDMSDVKSDVKNMQKDLEDLGDDMEDDIGRMSYVRQLTGEFLEYLIILNSELEKQVEIPKSQELMTKILGRSQRKRYYMSKFRL